MKILVVPSWYPPNGGRFFRNQAENLALLGHEVDVLILDEKAISQSTNSKIDATKSLIVNEIRSSYYRIPKLNDLNVNLFIKKFKAKLIKYLDINKPDVIHVHSAIWAGVVVSKIAIEKNIPYVITEHRSLFFEEKWSLNQKLTNEIRYSMLNAKRLIAVSNFMKAKLIAFLGTEKELAVIPNMIDTDYYKVDKSVEKHEKFTFITSGNLIKVKGFDILINAFESLQKVHKNVQLIIIGKGVEQTFLQNLVREKSLEKVILFKGYLSADELVKEFNKAHVYVSSSKNETFGVSIIEAMACGLPIVVTDSGGPTGIVNSKNGYLAENNNANSLHAKMSLMSQNYSNFDVDYIRNEVIEKYSNSVVIKNLEKQLLKCLKSKKL